MINQQLRKQASQECLKKAQLAKEYIEKKFEQIKFDETEKKQITKILTEQIQDMNLNEIEQTQLKNEIHNKQIENLRKKRQKININNFHPLAIIGRGAFGEVRLCKYGKDIVAVKKMKKSDMINKNQIAHCKAERDVLANSNNPWIVNLKYSFQDNESLYLVMEYLPGGDLMTLLIKKDILSEKESQFYAAECLLAIESIHKMNVTHRDLKPDNILIDRQGHIKLSDFGLCKFMEESTEKKNFVRNRKLAYSTVGTPDYIAPEVFSQNGYSQTVDYWSLGVILFEMILGYPPFYSDDQQTTCRKIINWQQHFQIPKDAKISHQAADIIKKLICSPQNRIGNNGINEIKMHPFFNGIDWDRLRERKAPFIPDVKSEIDTQNFDKFEELEPWYQPSNNNKINMQNHFVGYTYKRDCQTERQIMIKALENLQIQKGYQSNKTVLDKSKKVNQINTTVQNITNPTIQNQILNDNDKKKDYLTNISSYLQKNNNVQKQAIPYNIGNANEKSYFQQKNVLQEKNIQDKNFTQIKIQLKDKNQIFEKFSNLNENKSKLQEKYKPVEYNNFIEKTNNSEKISIQEKGLTPREKIQQLYKDILTDDKKDTNQKMVQQKEKLIYNDTINKEKQPIQKDFIPKIFNMNYIQNDLKVSQKLDFQQKYGLKPNVNTKGDISDRNIIKKDLFQEKPSEQNNYVQSSFRNLLQQVNCEDTDENVNIKLNQNNIYQSNNLQKKIYDLKFSNFFNKAAKANTPQNYLQKNYKDQDEKYQISQSRI